jgi:hypothetical protein
MWVWAIVTWGLLRFRPLLISLFGMDLQVPSVSDISIDDGKQGNNVWVRRVTMTGKTVWSWRGPKRHDILGLVVMINAAEAGSGSPPAST